MSYSADTIRVLHFADAHFGMENYGKIDSKTGFNSRLIDFRKAFQEIVNHAIEQTVDLVLFAGDAYKTREPTPTHQRLFAEGIHQITSANIPVVMIVGNHDLPGALGKSHTLDIFQALKVPNVHIIDRPRMITLAGVQIACLPWVTRSQFLTQEETKRLTLKELNLHATNKIRDQIATFDRQIDSTKPAILLAHGTIEGATFGSERIVELGTDVIIPLEVIKKSHFQYVALGHIHRHQTILDEPRVVYAGSIERIDFGEAKEDKGFMSVEFIQQNTRWQLKKAKHLSTHARRFESVYVELNDSDPDPTKTITQEISRHQIKEAVVRVIIQCSNHKASEIREGPIRDALQSASYIAAITKQITDRGRVQVEHGYSDELMSLQPIDLLEKFLKHKHRPNTRIEHLKQYAQLLIEDFTSAHS